MSKHWFVSKAYELENEFDEQGENGEVSSQNDLADEYMGLENENELGHDEEIEKDYDEFVDGVDTSNQEAFVLK